MKKRALISVFDKDGVLELAKFLEERDVEIISTGGTFKYLKENGVNVIEVNEVTNFPEMLDGRVKTLHPLIHAGILAIRDKEDHMNTLKERNINTIDYVVVNLYPFFNKVREDLTFEEKIEFIDIGGPTMLRSSAKNFRDVVVLSDKNDYKRVMDEISENGEVSFKLRKILAGKVFNLTNAYDAAISNFLLEGEEEYPEYLSISYKKKQNLRYGENPHQSAAYYSSNEFDGAMNSFEILNGKELSYNNIKDLDIAWKVCNEFEEIACCALKHNTPCGVAIGDSVFEVYKKAHDADPISIFGGIVAINREVDEETAIEMSKIFLEVVAAPSFTDGALEVLKKKKNLRVIKCNKKPNAKKFMVTVDGGILVQEEDLKLKNEMNVVTEKQPTESELRDMEFGMKVVKYVKSNAIVAIKDGVAIGIGGGQVNRILATTEALERGKGATILASDAFFPFRDCVDEAAKYGIKGIVQPGGSIRDEESIVACNEHGISMAFTGVRHFKH
ncbi:bifunctional phosphoribosylaminoimidazolecarboxamide formyltransferase/IMP cyclohydrolase [Clostridium thermobutyricum]|uniref:Bifunctional purine biosynthesis protein PurH n=1 Tax=Clostridium thermobutyricum DSM 4928 TaxID=1121339 RepID=A0A1V4SVW3_9CLOT|nr:bifunctional phosphoribosylaminoimidazolecarboxamide formyltransferase/IMP cyclohydrolase [Clostridium thermobutyricum]OPX47642.1 bifunctional purine biosynthesis protein PurH [Clostridium thermobutyricum DSM 4928]